MCCIFIMINLYIFNGDHIFKPFDKVWYERIIYKLKLELEFQVNLLKLLIDFLKNWKLRVVLNDQCLSWTNINAGVPQGCIRGPLLLIFINDLSGNLHCSPKLFTDDTSLYSILKEKPKQQFLTLTVIKRNK